ncbi:MAG: Zinc ABC transporter, periplasmic-binding protein ZnuA [Nitrosopumilales archaeon]|nr:MAG: Zinc ABC transporter, periplasmic-binding protein ZnuA [Nitrosopumilales archaeon]
MDTQTKIAIIAIVTIIPILSFAVWNIDQSIISAAADSTEISVMTSFYPLYEFTKQVGQDKVRVSLLVPPGIEPHDWEPTINELQKMYEANLIVINGIGFESWVDDIDTINSGVVIVDTSAGVSLINIDHSSVDPHIWLNPVMAKTQVTNIVNALIKIDPTNEKFYRDNAKSYQAKLDSLDTKIKNELSACKKDFITFHNAFLYFSIQYDLNQHTIIRSNDSHSEPTLKTLEQIINLAKKFNIDVIFAEEALDTRTSQVIANEIGAKVLVLSPIEVGDENSNYLSKMENNLLNLKEALCN